MSDLAALQVKVYGRVQGVFFRAFVSQRADELGLTGYARNLPRRDSLEVFAEGERKQLQELITHLKVGPPAAKVARVTTNWLEYGGRYSEFSVKY